MLPRNSETGSTFTKAWQLLVANSSNVDISVNDAWSIVSHHLFSPSIELCGINSVNGRILAKDVFADRDLPPFNRVSMDGICIRFEDFASGNRTFELTGIQAAGQEQGEMSAGVSAMEVMTGAVLPLNADTVIRYEDVAIMDNHVRIEIDDIHIGQNVHKRGLDRKKNDLLLGKGKKLSFAEIGVIAAVGLSEVAVFTLPKTAVVSTGSELVDVHENPLPHQIRMSNVYSLQAMLVSKGINPSLHHLTDNKMSMEREMADILNDNDVVLFSGSVSKGKFDFLPEVLTSLSVEKHFHRVQQRPGKPFWFGSRKDVVVFAFPGNPVSTAVCAIRYFEPWLSRSYSIDSHIQMATLGQDVTFQSKLQYFIPVVLRMEGATYIATPIPGHGSGDLTNLANANAFMELAADVTLHEKGSIHRIWSW